MKALTLWQPWASLVGEQVKTVETRSWDTSYRGPLAIHAAVREPALQDWPGPGTIVSGMGGRRYGEGSGQSRHAWGNGSATPVPLPLGVVVAVCRLVAIVDTVSCGSPPLWAYGSRGWYQRDDGVTLVSPTNYMLGDFGVRRFAWLLDDIVKLDPPIPARGRQQLWDWKDSIAC